MKTKVLNRSGFMEWQLSGNGNCSQPNSDNLFQLNGSSEIKIEYRARCAQAGHDFGVRFYDITNTANTFAAGTTSYQSNWLYTNGSGAFSLGQTGAGSNPSTNTKEYRITISGTSLQIQRGDTLASLTETKSSTLPTSISAYKFGMMMFSGGSPYIGAYVDWVKIYQGGVLLHEDNFTSLDSTIWRTQKVVSVSGGELLLGVNSPYFGELRDHGYIGLNLNATPTNITYTATDRGYQSQTGIFNGSNGYLNTGTNNLITTQGSVFAWIKTTRTTEQYVVTCGAGGASDTWYLGTGQTSSKLNVYLTATSSPGWHISNASVCDGNWHFVGFTYDGSNVRLWIDGVLDKTVATTGSMSTSSYAINIGQRIGSTPFLGNIQSLKISKQVASLSEIQDWYAEGLRKLGGGSLSPLMDGLVAYYDMRGDANDIVGGYNGTVTGATLTTNRLGDTNSAYNFSADGNKITASASTYGITGNFTLCSWIKTGTLSDNENMIFHKDGASGFRDFQFRVNNSDGTLTLFRGDTGGGAYCDFKTTGYSVEDGTFHFVCATFNSSSGSVIYIDGVSRATDGTTTGKTLSTQTLYIGGRSDSLADFNGVIDSPMIFNRALSADEVKLLYEASRKDTLLPYL